MNGNPLSFVDPYGLESIVDWSLPDSRASNDTQLNFRSLFSFLPPPPPKGPPGSGCGDEGSDCVIPDLYPVACTAHDLCYDVKKKSRLQCDNEFFWEMVAESGPQQNVIVPGLYWLGVRIGGHEAYQNAGKK